MDGSTLSREVRQLINETSASSYLDAKSTYDYLYEAAVATISRTNAFTSSQTITTVANQAPYKLNADYMKLYLTDSQNRNYVKYNDGSNDTFIFQKTYDSIYQGNQTDSVTVPSDFTVTDAAAIANITGTCGATSAISNGETTLSDVLAPFANVSAGDFVHNTTQDAHGIVVSVTSTSALVCAIFVDTSGTAVGWASSDAYIVVPQGRFQLVLNPPQAHLGIPLRSLTFNAQHPFIPHTGVIGSPLISRGVWLNMPAGFTSTGTGNPISGILGSSSGMLR